MARLLSLVLLLTLCGPILADVCLPAPPLPTQSYYLAPVVALRPVVVQPCQPVVVQPVQVEVCPPAIAIPTVAPRSVPVERPSPPAVSEFREVPRSARYVTASPTSFYRPAYYNPSNPPRNRDEVLVTLENRTDRGLFVYLDGVRYLILDGQSLTREVGREFTWQVEGRPPQREQVPSGEQGVRIPINNR